MPRGSCLDAGQATEAKIRDSAAVAVYHARIKASLTSFMPPDEPNRAGVKTLRPSDLLVPA
jgi:hypothetical protein